MGENTVEDRQTYCAPARATTAKSQTIVVGDWTYQVYYDEKSAVRVRRWWGTTGRYYNGVPEELTVYNEAPTEVLALVAKFR